MLIRDYLQNVSNVFSQLYDMFSSNYYLILGVMKNS